MLHGRTIAVTIYLFFCPNDPSVIMHQVRIVAAMEISKRLKCAPCRLSDRKDLMNGQSISTGKHVCIPDHPQTHNFPQSSCNLPATRKASNDSVKDFLTADASSYGSTESLKAQNSHGHCSTCKE